MFLRWFCWWFCPYDLGDKKQTKITTQKKKTKKQTEKEKETTKPPTLKLQITRIFVEPICYMIESKAAKKAPFCDQLPALNRSGRYGHKSQQLFPAT